MARPYKLAKEFPQVAEAYRNGATIVNLAKVYDCSPGTVRNILVKNNVTLRPRGRRKQEV